jgi:cell wall-associated NlpC family hydrolase
VPPSGVGGGAPGIAWAQVGKRYVYGGAGPNSFDCSGLTSYIYRQLGVYIPHSAASQYHYGVHIGSMSNLAPGDLMFFAGTVPGARGITHVGIYVGDGIMVHAGTPASGVQAVNIWGSYWTSHYVGATRLY